MLRALQVQQQQQQAKRETRAKYLVCSLPVDITSVTPPTNKPNPKLGISMMAWSPDSQLLATVNENMPHAVWVWDVSAAVLTAVLLHISTVRGLAWAPTGMLRAVPGSSDSARQAKLCCCCILSRQPELPATMAYPDVNTLVCR